MNMRMWLGALAALAWLGLSGCGEVESCKESVDLGCIDTPPDDSNNCKFGLVTGPNGTCVEPKDADAGVAQPDGPCSCPSGNACRRDGTCVDVCAFPNNLPVLKPKPEACGPLLPTEPAYTFEQAAIAACSVECVRRSALCGASCDPAVECTGARAVTAMALRCPTLAVDCAISECEGARDAACEQQECPGAAQPQCSNVLCTNTCSFMGESYANDGYCDDGDQSNGESAVCAWGTDCNDCGPRSASSTRPLPLYEYGQYCVDSLQCGQNASDFNLSTGWCVTFPAAPQRCLPDCTRSRKCPAGFTCTVLLLEPGVPYSLNGTAAQYCAPNACTQ